MARKTEVYTWRVSTALKTSLEEAARSEQRSVARLLEEIVTERLESLQERGRGEAARQRRLQARAQAFAGRIEGTNPHRAEGASTLVRARLRSAAKSRRTSGAR